MKFWAYLLNIYYFKHVVCAKFQCSGINSGLLKKLFWKYKRDTGRQLKIQTNCNVKNNYNDSKYKETRNALGLGTKEQSKNIKRGNIGKKGSNIS